MTLHESEAAASVPPRQAEARPSRTTFLSFALPHITQAEVDEVIDTLRSGWLSTGPKTKRFEREFAEAVGAPYAIAVNSATAALHLALDALGIGLGDEVIVPVYTFTSTAAVVEHCHARPVFVDVDPVTCNIDPTQLEAAITPCTRAVMVVHIAGLPAEMDATLAIAHAHGIPVIEDAAHAFPAKYRGRMVGTIGDLTAFSFYATKTLATGEGGMLTTANAEYAQRAAIMALHGISRDAWKRYSAEGSWFYEVLEPGYKYNMPDIAAALGLHQLARREWLLERRRAIAMRYHEAFSQMPELEPPPNPTHVEHAWHLYMLRLRPERLSITRDDCIRALTEAKIGTSVHFIPLHLHPYYRTTYHLAPQDFPNALDSYAREISLPIYPGMTDDDVADAIAAVEGIVRQNRRQPKSTPTSRRDCAALPAADLSVSPMSPDRYVHGVSNSGISETTITMKRAVDIAAATALLVVVAPVMALIACVVHLSGPGPVIYRGWRVGRDGHLFRILKFRTMSQAASGHEVTIHNDPRVTRLGRLLRATKLDELPQLLNVVKGDMSLVGPRPESPHYVAHYTPTQRTALRVRPGITGPSQVLYRHEEELLRGPDPEQLYLTTIMPAKLAIDVEYVRNHSVWGDVQILVRTVLTWILPRPPAARPVLNTHVAATTRIGEPASHQGT